MIVDHRWPLCQQPLLWLLTSVWLLAMPVAADFSQQAQVQTWVAQQQDLGHSQAQVLALLQKAPRQPKVIPVLVKAPESNWVWTDYRQRLLSQQRIKAGRKFMRHHAALLQNVAQTYGVPAHYIAAIAGVETNFGSYTGRFPTLGTLATLAFEHPRRQTYFRKELAHYLRLSYSQDFDPLTVRGSPAGAMGMAQFMPSSYQAYAVDGDGDGDIDLLTSVADSLASIANYLVRHGWQGEKPVWLAIEAQNPINEVSNKPKPGGKSLAAWQAKGIRLVTPLAELERNKVEYRLYPFTTHAETEYILATGNFYAITRYNHSLWYARLVAELADAINK